MTTTADKVSLRSRAACWTQVPRPSGKTGHPLAGDKGIDRNRMTPEAREKVFNFGMESLLAGVEIGANARKTALVAAAEGPVAST